MSVVFFYDLLPDILFFVKRLSGATLCIHDWLVVHYYVFQRCTFIFSEYISGNFFLDKVD